MEVLTTKLFVVLICFISCGFVFTADLSNSDIYTVTEETRFTALNPDVQLEPFNKVKHVKGNYVFNAGERITGDRLFLTFFDETQFTKSVDVEVFLEYPAKDKTGYTLTSIEIYADLSSDAVDVFFTSGGINKKFAEILIACNKTTYFTYEIYMYGY